MSELPQSFLRGLRCVLPSNALQLPGLSKRISGETQREAQNESCRTKRRRWRSDGNRLKSMESLHFWRKGQWIRRYPSIQMIGTVRHSSILFTTFGYNWPRLHIVCTSSYLHFIQCLYDSEFRSVILCQRRIASPTNNQALHTRLQCSTNLYTTRQLQAAQLVSWR